MEPDGNKREGLSQVLIDLKNTDGLELSPIPFLNGEHHFNEVSFNDVFVPDENVVGQPGMGWNQNTTEMAYERGGPDRWLSPFSTVEQLLRETHGTEVGERTVELFGELTARWWGLRNLSLSVARLIDGGHAPSVESSLVKEMGTRYEVELIEKLVEFRRRGNSRSRASPCSSVCSHSVCSPDRATRFEVARSRSCDRSPARDCRG